MTAQRVNWIPKCRHCGRVRVKVFRRERATNSQTATGFWAAYCPVCKAATAGYVPDYTSGPSWEAAKLWEGKYPPIPDVIWKRLVSSMVSQEKLQDEAVVQALMGGFGVQRVDRCGGLLVYRNGRVSSTA